MQVTASTRFSDLLQEVERFWTPLPDKPEETPERLLAALWSTACGAPVSADRLAAGDYVLTLSGERANATQDVSQSLFHVDRQ